MGISDLEAVLFSAAKPISIDAVSYTHLDVYKRQLLHCVFYALVIMALSLMVKQEIQMMIFCSIRINKLHQLL